MIQKVHQDLSSSCFPFYILCLGNFIHFHGFKCHRWADDSHIYLFRQNPFSEYIQEVLTDSSFLMFHNISKLTFQHRNFNSTPRLQIFSCQSFPFQQMASPFTYAGMSRVIFWFFCYTDPLVSSVCYWFSSKIYFEPIYQSKTLLSVVNREGKCLTCYSLRS